jgi:hypothetical protein
MDNQRFDRLVEALGRGLNRRGVLGVLAGAVGLGVGEVVAKGHRSRHRTQAAAAHKVTLCHHDQDAETWSPITISNNGQAVKKHKANHGDFEFGSGQASACCTDAECRPNETCVITVDAQGAGSGTCHCPPQCAGKPCGASDECGGTCGCPPGQACLYNGVCGVTCTDRGRPCPGLPQSCTCHTSPVDTALVCIDANLPVSPPDVCDVNRPCPPGSACLRDFSDPLIGRCFTLCPPASG